MHIEAPGSRWTARTCTATRTSYVILLYYIISYSILLSYIILYIYIISYVIFYILYYIILYYIILYYIILYYIIQGWTNLPEAIPTRTQ